MIERTGWLLDVYPDSEGGCAVWLVGEDGERYRLIQPFPIVFYVAGPQAQLRTLWKHLHAQSVPVRLARTERRDLFLDRSITVLRVEVSRACDQPALFQRVSQAFPDLTYYNADLPLPLRHAAAFGSFPLARCRAVLENNRVVEFVTLDSPWDTDPEPPPLRTLMIEPDCDPRRCQPTSLLVRDERGERRFSLEPARALLINLSALLRQCDPDLLLTTWGDSWLLPHLLELSRQWRIPLPLNRDLQRGVSIHAERSYFSYGQIIHRDQQLHLFGRAHIDVHNAMLYHDYGLEGVFELARVTGLPLQTVSRTSPGSGVSAMQMITALHLDVLVPWHKQEAEKPKSTWDLMRADQGGLVYQPITGLHENVAELDFISMFPNIMVHRNISPETIQSIAGPEDPPPEREPGLIPQTLAPLLDKRLTFKRRLNTLPHWDARRKLYKARSSAHKWLLVTSFGYLGYKNARFGRIEAHEAVTAYSREALLRAKETAEDLGYSVLHMYVDGIWVRREDGKITTESVEPLIDEIAARTGLPIALEGIYNWVAFLPSRQNASVPVANRYFGVYEDGSIKTRGIEGRRRDTPGWVARVQQNCLDRLAREPNAEQASRVLPEVLAYLRTCLRDLTTGRVPLEELVVAHKLSRELEEFRSASPASSAAKQLQGIGKSLRPGQLVRFLYLIGKGSVHAWDLPHLPNPARIDRDRYAKLLLRAASTILQPFGIDEARLRKLVFYPTLALRPSHPYAVQLRLPGILKSQAGRRHPALLLPVGMAKHKQDSEETKLSQPINVPDDWKESKNEPVMSNYYSTATILK
jgi:DNA polymerase-2